MIDVAVAIDGEAWTVQLTRKAVGTYVDGHYLPGTATTTSIRATIQPAKGTQLMDLPEGVRREALHLLWSRSTVLLDDTIIDGAISYRVMFIWPRREGAFTRAALGMLR